MPAFLAALSDPPQGLRVNTLRLERGAFESIAPFPLERLAFPDTGYIPRGQSRAGRDPYHAAGLYYLQDPSAMAVGALVGARPGERILDLAAAPGGKTTHIAAMMRNAGVILANDISRPRARELARNLERCGVRNAIVTTERVDRLAAALPGFFDRVLLDAPCSGEAMFARSEAARTDWSSAAVEGCAGRQEDLIREAAALVRPGGLLVYSTCTFSMEENERVIERFLREHPDFSTDPLVAPGADAVALAIARDGESGDGEGDTPSSLTTAEGGAVAYRLWPHRSAGAGHFVVALRRRGDDRVVAAVRGETVAREAMEALRLFMREVYPETEFHLERIVERGGELYQLPADAPDMSRLHVLRPGHWLGSLRRGRFEPAHALALVINPREAPGRVDLTRDDPRVARYLQGETITSDGPAGWIPVTVDGFALGWGKRVGTTVKNHYPKGLRWR